MMVEVTSIEALLLPPSRFVSFANCSHGADTCFTCFYPSLARLLLTDAVHRCVEHACGHWKGADSSHDGAGDLH